MRGDLLNLSFRAINKQSSGLLVKCPEIPHYPRWRERHARAATLLKV